MRINQSQQLVILIAIIVAILAGLFPPWVRLGQEYGLSSREFTQGGNVIFSPPSVCYVIDYRMLLVELFVIALAAAGGMILLSKSEEPVMDKLRAWLSKQFSSNKQGAKWWYKDKHGATCGPVTQSRLVALLQSKQLPADTLVCRPGQTVYVQANMVEDFAALSGRTVLPATQPTRDVQDEQCVQHETPTLQSASPMSASAKTETDQTKSMTADDNSMLKEGICSQRIAPKTPPPLPNRRASLRVLLIGYLLNVVLAIGLQLFRLTYESPTTIWWNMSREMYIGIQLLEGHRQILQGLSGYAPSSDDSYIARAIFCVTLENALTVFVLTAVCFLPLWLIRRRRLFASRGPFFGIAVIVSVLMIANARGEFLRQGIRAKAQQEQEQGAKEKLSLFMEEMKRQERPASCPEVMLRKGGADLLWCGDRRIWFQASVIYANGLYGFAPDPDEALSWCKQAALNGSIDAKRVLRQCGISWDGGR